MLNLVAPVVHNEGYDVNEAALSLVTSALLVPGGVCVVLVPEKDVGEGEIAMILACKGPFFRTSQPFGLAVASLVVLKAAEELSLFFCRLRRGGSCPKDGLRNLSPPARGSEAHRKVSSGQPLAHPELLRQGRERHEALAAVDDRLQLAT